MSILLRTAVRKTLAWLTGKFLGEVIVSAVATLILTAVFSGSGSHEEKPAPASAMPVLASVPPPQPSDFKVSINSAALTMAPDAFAPEAPLPPRRPTALGRTASTRAPAPAPRPRPTPVVAGAASPAPVQRLPQTSDDAPKTAAPARRSFALFGVGPADLIPSPKHILGDVSSVGHSIADLAAWL